MMHNLSIRYKRTYSEVSKMVTKKKRNLNDEHKQETVTMQFSQAANRTRNRRIVTHLNLSENTPSVTILV